jgi:hypothetical protein
LSYVDSVQLSNIRRAERDYDTLFQQCRPDQRDEDAGSGGRPERAGDGELFRQHGAGLEDAAAGCHEHEERVLPTGELK